MSFLIDKAAFVAQIHKEVSHAATSADGSVCGMHLLHIFAGIIAETSFLFEDPETACEHILVTLGHDLGCDLDFDKDIHRDLPPSHIIDQATESGRAIARTLFEDWLHCSYEFHDLLNFVLHQVLLEMEDCGEERTYCFGVLVACVEKCMSYEVAAQELCDLVIDKKIGDEGWSIAQSVSGLSAVAGRFLGLSPVPAEYSSSESCQKDDEYSEVAYVMTQEAVRLGIPAGSDWRLGLAANDYPVTAPFDLIFSLVPHCQAFFSRLSLFDDLDRAVACAKAAGRMLAVAAGGKYPELEPVVAKPLAMAAFTDTYKTLRREEELTV